MPTRFRKPSSPYDGFAGGHELKKAKKPGPDKANKTVRILIVDDESIAILVACAALKKDGRELIIAKNGREGLERFRAGGVDLVVSDLLMPEMGGQELLAAIKRESPDTKVVIMSGTVSEEEETRLLEMGAVAVLRKPFENAEMQVAVERALTTSEAVAKKMTRILVVDDEPELLYLLQTVLKNEGRDIQTAANGEEGLRMYMEGDFDLVMSDVVMPEMDGHSLLRAIKKHDPNAKVLMMSGTARREERDRLLDAGAVDLLSKPFMDLGAVKRTVAGVLEETKATILVVDGEPSVTQMFSKALGPDYKVETTENGDLALERFKSGGIDLVMTSIQTTGLDGVTLLWAIKAHDEDANVIVMSGGATRDQIDSVRMGGGVFMEKSSSFAEIIDLVKRTLSG